MGIRMLLVLCGSIIYTNVSECRVSKLAYFIHNINPKLSTSESLLYEKAILLSSKKYDIDKHLLASVLAVETHYNKNVVGSLGELGLGQVRPQMHALHIKDYNKRVTYLKNPLTSIDETAKIIKYVQDNSLYGSKDMRFIEAYNRGLGNPSKKFKYYNKIRKYYEVFKKYDV